MYLYIFAPGNLLKVLLLLQGLIHLVVRHAEAPQSGLHRVIGLREHHKLGHVGDADEVPVQLHGQTHRLWDLVAVRQPEPARVKNTMMHISDTEKPDQNNDTQACRVSHLAETFVVKETQSLTKVRGVVPVMSSHCAGDVPPDG